jgi:hypothetical protein
MTKNCLTTTLLLVASLLMPISEVAAFQIHSHRTTTCTSRQRTTNQIPLRHIQWTDKEFSVRKSPSSLHAFLPPSDNRNNDGLGTLASSLLTVGLTLAFFLSPLGAFVLGLFNSLIILTILTPVMLLVGFNIWQSFNTISGTCPSCGAPATVMKRQPSEVNAALETSPSICLNCGAALTASPDNTDIDLVFGGMSDSSGTGFFENFFSTPNPRVQESSVSKRDENAKRFRREQTVIDVDVED